MSASRLREDAKKHALKAIEFDQQGELESAKLYYLVGEFIRLFFTKQIFFKISNYLIRRLPSAWSTWKTWRTLILAQIFNLYSLNTFQGLNKLSNNSMEHPIYKRFIIYNKILFSTYF